MTPPAQNLRRAALMILGASALIAGTTILAKILGTTENPLHPLQVSAGRFFFAFLAITSFALLTRQTLNRPNLPRHAARLIIGWTGVTLMFAAVARIPCLTPPRSAF